MKLEVSGEVAEIIERSILLAKNAHFAYVTPELMLYVVCQNPVFAEAFENCGGTVQELDLNLRTYLEQYMEREADEDPGEGRPELTHSAGQILADAWESVQNSGRTVMELTHMIHAMYNLKESYAVYYMRVQGVEQAELLKEMLLICEENEVYAGMQNGKRIHSGKGKKNGSKGKKNRGKGKKDSGIVIQDAEAGKQDAGGGKQDAEAGRHDVSAGTDGIDNGMDDIGAGTDSIDSGMKDIGAGTDGIDSGMKDIGAGTDGIDSGMKDIGAGMDGVGGGMQDRSGMQDHRKSGERGTNRGKGSYWKRYAVCVNDSLEGCNPLIGRKEELERTMQILCRKEKNNPLHIGEPGVGKTAIIYGFARLLKDGQVPEPLLGARIFSLDLGSLLAGTQYRGDFEKRFKKVMESISLEEKPVIYIDEIHNIVGAGAVNGGSFDISNMLKPYLSEGHIRFIGATTFEEYKKHFEKSKSLVRRFQNIEIKEPGIQDTVRILEGLRENYEQFHGVRYEDGVLEYAASVSAKYMNERYLPDKAIDLIDEAGAYRRMHPLEEEQQTVGRELIDEIVAKTCQIPKQAVESEEAQSLATLEERLKNLVYGQDEAVAQVVNAVKFSRAGLLEEDKPLASLLFVGPTGVGKTEIAKSLAKELGIRLIRFDMSEYEEKHAVAKLIGAPAGYVGYEEGGLLTEEIRRHPHAVLLLDEIEKAHPDIYNILLQVMDYATLTDNQGRKADFRNVIIIMTSNAGASRIGKPGIGFLGEDVSADIVLEEVKRVFQPEFRNRLNRIVAFHGMNEKMAGQIVEKKLDGLQQMLLRKHVQLTADTESKELIKKKGISTEFGAREIERVIQGEIKPLFVDEILFGRLKEGGKCSLTAREGRFRIEIAPE